ncbi:hypothetical protein [Streptomyces sp. NBC_00091]|uniref:hypothetical protein n=1 Tax=Streptomyces sp. NBC_00091 TaxID=2975648 RepID=UPI00224F02FF|nr:hypothetical protein [Streptomyces sp. NBC_00091]MCX5375882.1 hypothetical protein [Streptomyces sp. NBC_00091]
MVILDVLTDMAMTGRLGPVFIGADWSDVTAALGEPWDVGTTPPGEEEPHLFAYGDLELSVCPCRKVSLICVQTWREVIELPRPLAGGTGTFPGEIRQAEVVSALDAAGCPWQPYLPLTFGDQRTLMAIPSGAAFTFELLEDEEPVLNVMGLPGDRHDCTAPQAGTGSASAYGLSMVSK